MLVTKRVERCNETVKVRTMFFKYVQKLSAQTGQNMCRFLFSLADFGIALSFLVAVDLVFPHKWSTSWMRAKGHFA